jgi:D-xylulose reductase
MESGKVNLKPLITDRYRFEESVAAFEYAANPKPSSVKIIIGL